MSDLVEWLRFIASAGVPDFAHSKRLEDAADEIERLREALQALHDWYVEYARINNLFNPDGSPATFHELLEARRVLGGKL